MTEDGVLNAGETIAFAPVLPNVGSEDLLISDIRVEFYDAQSGAWIVPDQIMEPGFMEMNWIWQIFAPGQGVCSLDLSSVS